MQYQLITKHNNNNITKSIMTFENCKKSHMAFVITITMAFLDFSNGYVSLPRTFHQSHHTTTIAQPKSLLHLDSMRTKLQMTATMNSTAVGANIDFSSFPRQRKNVFFFDETTSEAETVHGMPWKSSIAPYSPSSLKDTLLFMPFWEWQLSFMKSSLTNLESTDCDEFSYNENKERNARVVNASYKSDEYRKIRMTYYDAGDKAQVFNSLWYPDESYDAPLLGIDLLAFNRKKFLVVVDFQPLPDNHRNSKTDYTEFVRDIHESLPSTLKGKMSARFYDENQFFSDHLLFGRFEDEDVIYSDVFEAFGKYVQNHVDMVQRHIEPDSNDNERILEGQRQYDVYSAARDPAHALFTRIFGKEWADAYVYDFLFSMSKSPEP